MHGEIIVENTKAVQFEPCCIRCGNRTRGRLVFNKISTEPFGLMIGILSNFFLVIEIISKAFNMNIWVPFCWKCKWNTFFPDRKCVYHLVAALVLICFGAYCFVKDNMVLGGISFLFAVAGLCIAGWKNGEHRKNSIPVRLYRNGRTIQYVFTSGDYYERMNNKFEQEESGLNIRTYPHRN